MDGDVELRVASVNLRAYPNPGKEHIGRMAAIIGSRDPDVVLLQECRRSWLDVICNTAGHVGVHAHDVAPQTPRSAYSPDGVAIAVRAPITIAEAWRIPPEEFFPESVQRHLYEEPPDDFVPMPRRLSYRYSGRSLVAELQVADRSVVVGSFHATPGSSKVGGQKVHEWKPFFHGAVALHLSRLESGFVFGIDANEPLSETVDDVRFHWPDDRSGVEKLRALLGLDPLHGARDLFREWFHRHDEEPASNRLLTATHAPNEDFQRRFDSMWATSDFEVTSFATHLDEIVAAGGDHALLVADLRV